MSGNSPPAETLTAQIERFCAARRPPGNAPLRLCVAFSGGMDSVVLLHALRQLPLCAELSALYVHHGLSPNADGWADFCADVCRDWGVPLEIVRIQTPSDSGEGIEGAARRLRYQVFAACTADWLALAQHRDDQAETLLLNLLRGAGVAGAAGMPAERRLGSHLRLIRPLLDVPRREIEAYAQAHGLRWIEDESNDDRRFRRNFLRHDILPPLTRHFPGAAAALARASGHFAEAVRLLDDLAEIDRQRLAAPSGRIMLDGLRALPVARARNLLRHLWRTAGFRAPDARWLDETLRQLTSAADPAEICLETVDGQLRVYRGELYFVRPPAPPPQQILRWQGEASLPWAGGAVRFVAANGQGLRRSLLAGCILELRPRAGGERLQTHPLRPRRPLRKLWQEAAIPPWERSALPLLWCDGKLAWAGLLGVDAAFACPPQEEGIQPLWADGHDL